MKLKKSSGSKMDMDMDKARKEIADQISPGRSTARTVSMIVGGLVALGAIVFAIMTLSMDEEEF